MSELECKLRDDVKRLKAEIEKLKEDRDGWHEQFARLEIERASCCMENEEEVKRLMEAIKEWDDGVIGAEHKLRQIARGKR